MPRHAPPKRSTADLDVDLLHSTIGVHDIKATFRDKTDGHIVGYGWFDQAALDSLVPAPETLPELAERAEQLQAEAEAVVDQVEEMTADKKKSRRTRKS
jgi:hypothetical protein